MLYMTKFTIQISTGNGKESMKQAKEPNNSKKRRAE